MNECLYYTRDSNVTLINYLRLGTRVPNVWRFGWATSRIDRGSGDLKIVSILQSPVYHPDVHKSSQQNLSGHP